MPPKRKATDPAGSSPSKRAAVSKPNAAGQDTPARRTRSSAYAGQPINTPSATPKVKRMYGKRAIATSEMPQDAKNVAPEQKLAEKAEASAQLNSARKTPGHKTQGERETPSERRSTRASPIKDPVPPPIETLPKVKRTYTKKVVVEVPPLPEPRSTPQAFQPAHQASTQPTEPLCEVSATPRKHKSTTTKFQSPPKGILLNAKQLPPGYLSCLNAQKRAILRSLDSPSQLFSGEDENSTDHSTRKQLEALLAGTIERSEGNSCLVLGPRGSGKSTVVDQCLTSLPERPIIIRLSGWAHHTDRLAMREIAYQLGQQTGKSFLQAEEDEDEDITEQDDNPFLDHPKPQAAETGLALPPPSHLPALISVIPTLSRPTVVILDAFDLFALHPRQALLYCLLDTVQGCRTGTDIKGLAVIGLTARIDTINLLEKRVKSRFSGRVLRTSPASVTTNVQLFAKNALCVLIPPADEYKELQHEWNDVWSKRVSECLEDKEVLDMMKDTVGITKDLRMISRILMYTVARLSPSSPFPLPSIISQAIASQRSRPPSYESLDLPYPALCLLIASMHSIISGHDVFTFEMLFNTFHNQVRASTAAPVQMNGRNMNMIKCSRTILLGAFEHLVISRVFVGASASSGTTAKEFTRYRTMLDREDVRKIVERTGQVELKKWLNKAD